MILAWRLSMACSRAPSRSARIRRQVTLARSKEGIASCKCPYNAVFTKTGNRRPDLDYRPRAWCPRCNADVDAVQVFNPKRTRGSYRQQYRYRCPTCVTEALPYVAPAAGIIDWSLPCPPIGERSKPLAKSTIDRIRAYLERHGFGPALVPSGGSWRTDAWPVDRPMRTVLTAESDALAWPFVDTARRNATGRSVDLPLTSVAAEGNHHYLVEPFIDTARTNNAPRPASLPMSTLSTGNHHYLVFPERGYVVGNYSPGWLRDADRLPLGAITTKDHHALLVQVAGNTFQRPGSTCRIRSADEPMRTQVATLQEALVRLPADFLVSYYGKGNGRSAAEPAGALTSHDMYALARPPEAVGRDLDEFIQACGYRMLTSGEVGRAMAFPDDYEVTGNKDEQVAQYGNAVTPPVMSWVFGRTVASLDGEGAAA
jgi:DNA (cytosine-5)-methyltransferase 1